MHAFSCHILSRGIGYGKRLSRLPATLARLAGRRRMIFEQVVTGGGCQSYLIGCSEGRAAALIDPEVRQIDHYLALASQNGVRVRFVIDTHTHADHFSATKQLAEQLEV